MKRLNSYIVEGTIQIDTEEYCEHGTMFQMSLDDHVDISMIVKSKHADILSLSNSIERDVRVIGKIINTKDRGLAVLAEHVEFRP